MARKKATSKAKIPETPEKLYVCSCCGREFQKGETHFYKNHNSRNYASNDGFTTICIKCVGEMFEDYRLQFQNQKLACMIMCAKLDYPFYQSLYDSVHVRNDNFTFGLYVRQVNCAQYSGKTFASTLASGELQKEVQESIDDFEEDWPMEDRRTKNEVIKLLGRDPFVGYVSKDRKYLFNEFLQYLDDEELLADQYKVSQLIQLLNNNNQINQYDVALSRFDPVRNVDDIRALSSLKKDLVASNEKIAKENGFSMKSRGENRAGKGTLTNLMREMREKDIKGCEANFYDQLQSENTKWAANVSSQSLMENCHFDDTDVDDIIVEQRKLISETQRELDDLKEEARVWKAEKENTMNRLKELEAQLAGKAGDVDG